MFEDSTGWQAATGALLLLIPLCYALAAVAPARGPHAAAVLGTWTARAAGVTLGLAVLLGAILAAGGGGVFRLATLLPLGDSASLALSVRLDALTAVMLVLVCFIGGVILAFSRRYLHADPGLPRYLRALMATLAAVALLVASNNLLLLTLAWIGTSLALHRLLTFYADRPQAVIVAHKKFLASRVAELAMLGAVGLVGATTGSLELDRVFAYVDGLERLPAALEAAAVLLAVAAILKCAQLPLHGWLIQVMEAPTPVSALLHAGIVNIGGFLMIRLSPLMVHADAAQTLLVAVGCATAVVAGLVMTTRISIKVMLAWSTCAQMGFMLVQCGLGAYSLALLHLVAHSLYKSHAFLASGSIVEQWRTRWQAPALRVAGPGRWLAGAALAALAVTAAAALWGVDPRAEPAVWALGAIVTLALVPLLVRGSAGGWPRAALLGGSAVGVAMAYFAWHALFSQLLPATGAGGTPTARLAIVLAGFATLFALQVWLATRPDSPLSRRLYPTLFAGLYLDELFTRVTFRVWPARQANAETQARRAERAARQGA